MSSNGYGERHTFELFPECSIERELTNLQLTRHYESLQMQVDSIHQAGNIRVDQAVFACETRLGTRLDREVAERAEKQAKRAKRDRIFTIAVAMVFGIGSTIISRMLGM